jgi:outer membrane protein TolC
VAQVREARSRRAVSDLIYEAYRRVENGIVKSRSARAQVEAANKAADLAVERYQAGVSTQLDVTQAQRDAFLAEASRIQADADLAFARASLRLAAGRSPSDTRNP